MQDLLGVLKMQKVQLQGLETKNIERKVYDFYNHKPAICSIIAIISPNIAIGKITGNKNTSNGSL